MTPLEWYLWLRAWLIIGQAVYWYLLRDDGREQVVWDACLAKVEEEPQWTID